MLKVAQAICYLFASLVIALFTLVLKSDTFEPRTASAVILSQDLSTIRVWIVVIGLSVYSWRVAEQVSDQITDQLPVYYSTDFGIAERDFDVEKMMISESQALTEISKYW